MDLMMEAPVENCVRFDASFVEVPYRLGVVLSAAHYSFSHSRSLS